MPIEDIQTEEVPAQEQVEIPADVQESEKTENDVQEDPQPGIRDILEAIGRLESKFDQKIAVDEHKNGLFDKLYKERDEYKNDLYAKLLKPFVTGAIAIINDLRSYVSKMENYDTERSLEYLRTLPDDIAEMLEDNGVEIFAEESDVFNPRTQRARRTVVTEDPDMDNRIAERISKGYRWNGAVLQPEMVAVYKVK